ncbi:conserved hypothetical protein [Desulfosarcina cetonica]|uniref:4'-phosphopantetheinyl transferase family protein n=1 Tax=Desulfosarcina cetonica TaxID=90730 RepID=UPI0006D076B7|nr:4'-phosphopantetheinyl transferase superfamily protein [Desulfosarcina cetonica]VTR70856.1 conserved hypothetical protein [Desulfosarcina cetonica]
MKTLYPVILPVSADQRGSDRRAMVKILSRLARVALTRSCQISGLRLDSFPKDADGVPLPVDGVHWSLSHKTDVVGGVAAPMPVGIDLETMRPVHAGLLDRVADAAEWAQLIGDPQRNFFRIWTAKEAVLKAVGKGFAGLSRCRVKSVEDETQMLLTFDAQPWPVRHHWFGDHVAAITVRDDFTVAWQTEA